MIPLCLKDGLPLLTSLFICTIPALAQAQSITPAPDGTGTVINQVGNTTNIEGGTQAGSNLFHSFQKFGLDTGQIANFLSNPAIQNILGRVTGGEASVINGSIQVTGSTANLYLMNPAGIIFGANASLNVPGSFTATTANGIGFGSNQWFNAVGTNDYANLVGTPNSFAFTMTQPGAIVNAGTLAVPSGQALSLIGGTVVSTGTLSAPGGQIIVATVPGESFVQISETGQLLSLEILPLNAAANLPNAWTLPIATLPQLLTGSGFGNATGLVDNGDGTISLAGSGLRVENGDLVATNVSDASITGNRFANAVLMSASRNLIVGDVETSGSGSFIRLLATGNINAGNVDTQTDTEIGFTGRSVQMQSTTGDITVKTINAGGGGIDITAAGLFRAIGIFDSEGYSSSLIPRAYPSQDPEFLPFITDKTGLTETQYRSLPLKIEDIVFVPAPVSLKTFMGNITIRHGGGSSLQHTESGVAASGNAPFVVGPSFTAAEGDKFVPRDSTDNFANFAADPFSLVKTGTFTPTTIPNEASGTIGAIIINTETNGSLKVAVQDRVFGVLPKPPEIIEPIEPPKPPITPPKLSDNSSPNDIDPNVARFRLGPDGQVAQRQLNRQRRGGGCNSSRLTAVKKTGESDRDRTTPELNTTNDPCASTADDEQILKILEDDPSPNKELLPNSISTPERIAPMQH